MKFMRMDSYDQFEKFGNSWNLQQRFNKHCYLSSLKFIRKLHQINCMEN